MEVSEIAVSARLFSFGVKRELEGNINSHKNYDLNYKGKNFYQNGPFINNFLFQARCLKIFLNNLFLLVI